MTAPSTILITGANRGIGLGLAREFLDRGWRVFATCRDLAAADELQALARTNPTRLEVLSLEVRDEASVAALTRTVAARTTSLDVLVNNAGIQAAARAEKIGGLDLAAVSAALAVNTVAPMAVTQALLPLLRAGHQPRIVNISSGAGSMKTLNTRAHYGYSISKAALNMFVRRAAADLAPLGVTIVSVSPGWIKTDMGGAEADLTVEAATAALADTIANLSFAQNGQWLDRFGQLSEYAW